MVGVREAVAVWVPVLGRVGVVVRVGVFVLVAVLVFTGAQAMPSNVGTVRLK